MTASLPWASTWAGLHVVCGAGAIEGEGILPDKTLLPEETKEKGTTTLRAEERRGDNPLGRPIREGINICH